MKRMSLIASLSFCFFALVGCSSMTTSTQSPRAVASVVPNQEKVEIENAFQDASGHYFVMLQYKDEVLDKTDVNPDFVGTNTNFYGDAKSLHQLQDRGGGGSTDSFSVRFDDPRLDKNGMFLDNIDEDSYKATGKVEVVCGATQIPYRTLTKEEKDNLATSIRSGATSLEALPTTERQNEYAFKFKKNPHQYIYVDASKYNYAYESFKLYVGTPGKMKEEHISNVERFSDGGTTIITMDNGDELFSPTPLNQSKRSTWNKSNIVTELDRQKFDPKILKIPGVPSLHSQLHTPCDAVFSN